VAAVGVVAGIASGCGLEQLSQGGGGGKDSKTASDAGTDAADASIAGQGCGVERSSGATLCAATSACPSIVVDTQALPHCGFRIRGGSTELVCGCGDFICSMGTYTTCTQAAQLLTSQTESAVCQQVAEGRCTDATPTGGSSGSSGSGKPTCDKECYQQCGGGAGCASMCGC
jgi:hypothetical protein